MLLASDTPLELKVAMTVHHGKHITVAQPELLRISNNIQWLHDEALGFFLQHNKFFVIVNGPSYWGINLQDLQHGVDALLSLLKSYRPQYLDLVLQECLVHGGLWQNLDSTSIMKLADLVLRREAEVTINNRARKYTALGAASQVAALPIVSITVPAEQKQVIQTLSVVFLAAASHQDNPVRGGLRQFVESRLRAITPSVDLSPLISWWKLPDGLVIQSWYPWYILPDQGNQGLNTAQDVARLGDRETHLGWFPIMLRSLRTHRSNVQREIQNLVGAQGGHTQTCFLVVGESLGGYIRSMDRKSDEFLPVDLRLKLARNELELTLMFIENVTTKYQLMRPLNR